ncbi:hypothetical protein [Microbulbifer sp. TYP-18]|uniref:hypothetical protein n=1 Tax=Microbulbifer sp. TYP-18 TaxID=3230024 RepID=UPI0034C6A1FF
MTNTSTFLIVSAAIAGYIFSTICYKFKYKVARESGYKLYLTSLTFGLVFLYIAWSILELTYWFSTLFNINPIFSLNALDETIVISINTLLISILVAQLYNIKEKYSRFNSLHRVWQKNDYDLICFQAIGDYKPIALSHESGKVYVGYVIDTLSPDEENRHLTILPVLSGYRAQITHQFILMVRYNQVISLIDDWDGKNPNEMKTELQDYLMAFPRDKINSLHIFNPDLYKSTSAQYADAKQSHAKTTKKKSSGITADLLP